MKTRLARIKPYKAASPEKTVGRISSILNETGLTLVEKPIPGESSFKASILSIVNPLNNTCIFSTYGKGSTDKYASASAWGEMIERIQNLVFYMVFLYPGGSEGRNQENKFVYFPDEKPGIYTSDQGKIGPVEQLPLSGWYAKNNKGKIAIGVPFKNIFGNSIDYLPFRAMHVIVGSNGMCSGNTRDEALIQGISEVFERYLLKLFYLKPFCPPDIPASYFHGTEIEKTINRLIKQDGMSIKIKDCSYGKKYPVIGVLVRNKNDEYAFHLGADPSPITALERCFTEMFQGGAISFQSLKILKENLPYDLNNSFWKKNLDLNIRSYSGQWPPDILSDSPAYEFLGFDHPESVSDSDDLQYLFKILKNDQRQLFIRDNSVLGYPTYYVYIPGMSEITTIPDSRFSMAFLAFDDYLPVLTNLNNATVQRRSEMLELIYRYIEFSPRKSFAAADYFRYNPFHPLIKLNCEQFLSLIDFSLMEGTISDNFSQEEIRSNDLLRSLYERALNPSDIFKIMNLPHCFECDDCYLKKDCGFSFFSSVWEKIKVKMAAGSLNQSETLKF